MSYTSNRSLSAVVMAAGEGTRMRSSLAKPAHRIHGRAMVCHVLDALREAAPSRIVVVVGHGAEVVRAVIETESGISEGLRFALQAEQHGTGHAVTMAMPELDSPPETTDVIVMPGDQPLFRSGTLAALVDAHRTSAAAATLLTAKLSDATGLGRVIRSADGSVERIVEHRDATEQQRKINEINTSVYCFRLDALRNALARVTPDNAQGEYYLTDVVGLLRDDGLSVEAHVVSDSLEALGVNDRAQLATCESELRRRVVRQLLAAGVAMPDPDRVDAHRGVVVGRDTTLLPGTALYGTTVIGEGCEIGPDTTLVDTLVGAGAVIRRTEATGASVGEAAVVGPLCVLSPGSVVVARATVLPFTHITSEDVA